MKPASKAQLSALHSILWKKNLLQYKAEMVDQYSNGRTTSSKELTMDECRQLLMDLYATPEQGNKDDKGPMIRKLFAQAHEMGWITKKQEVNDKGVLVEVNDNKAVYEWVKAHGYLRKDLRQYTYKELPKLISVFEEKIYKPFLQKLLQKRG